MNNMKWLGPIFKVLQNIVMKKESATGIYVAGAQELVGTTGKYFEKKKQLPLNFDNSYKSKLLKASDELLSKFLNA